jgi:hypothetical protein
VADERKTAEIDAWAKKNADPKAVAAALKQSIDEVTSQAKRLAVKLETSRGTPGENATRDELGRVLGEKASLEARLRKVEK